MVGEPACTGPSDLEMLAALRAMRPHLAVFCEWLAIVATPAVVYTADSLPPNVKSRDSFLRSHRRQSKNGTPGWARCGQVRSSR
jgi:hypothetical protein